MFGFCMNMKVLNQNNNIAFKSVPIHHVNVRNAKTGELIPAMFSKLIPSDPKDYEAISRLSESWEKDSFEIFETFCKHFLGKHHAQPTDKQYRCIELLGNEKLDERIIGISETKTEKFGNLHGAFLFVKPELNATNPKRTIKGIGEVLNAEVFDLAKKLKAPFIDFQSSDDVFYRATFKPMGVIAHEKSDGISDLTLFVIDEKEFDKYLNYMSDKYKIDFSA